MEPRFKPCGLERLPTPRYNSRAFPTHGGQAWVYKVEGGVVVLKTDFEKVLTIADENMIDINVYKYSNPMQDFILECARRELSLEDALKAFRATYGEPDIILDVADINDVHPEVRAELNTGPPVGLKLDWNPEDHPRNRAR